MKFVTVMDMWLLLMNGILLGAILYYGRKLVDLVKVASDSNLDESIKKAVKLENQRVVSIINSELKIYNQMVSMGDKDAIEIANVLKMLVEQVEPKGNK